MSGDAVQGLQQGRIQVAAKARKMFRKSPYLDHLPVLSLQPEQLSRYRLRRSRREDHLCTSEVAALCLALAGEPHAAHQRFHRLGR